MLTCSRSCGNHVFLISISSSRQHRKVEKGCRRVNVYKIDGNISVCLQSDYKWLEYSTGYKDQLECQGWKEGNKHNSRPPYLSLSFILSIQGPWALCQVRILRTHSKKAKERDLFKSRTHSREFFPPYISHVKRDFCSLFSDIASGDRGGRICRIAIHVTFLQIHGLRVLWASDLPSEPPLSLSNIHTRSLSHSFHSALSLSLHPPLPIVSQYSMRLRGYHTRSGQGRRRGTRR